MSRRIVIAVLLGGVSLFMLVRNWNHLRRPAWESHITGDAAARAGITAVEKGQFAEAIRALEFALGKPRLEVADGDVYAALGEAYAGLDRDGAGESQRHQALLYEGFAQRARGDLEKAAATFARAQEAKPDYALAWESLGSVRLVEGRPQEAIAQLEHAIELDPAKAVTRSNLAVAYAQVGRFGDAELQVRQAESLGYPKLEQLRSLVERLRTQETGRE